MKEYLSFEGLSHFFEKLIDKFSIIGHTHKKSEITDFQDMSLVIADDDNGNVSIALYGIDNTDNDRLTELETNYAMLRSAVSDINNNDLLVANNVS